MMFQRFFLSLLLLLCTYLHQAQGIFQLPEDEFKETVPFALVNNMIVISAEVNGKKLSLILDTGIRSTMLFNLKLEDSLQLKNVENIQLHGLGQGEPINALISRGNHFKIKNALNPSLSIFVITDDLFDLTSKMGRDIHGIIGGDLFNDLVVKIDYGSRKLTFYRPKDYDKIKCNKCETFPLDFYNNKPFIKVVVENYQGKRVAVNLLIDSGGGDSLWLFPHSNPDILVGDQYFDDFLGRGLNGDILGKRSRIKKLKIGSFEFENASVSYPDSTSILKVHANTERNGTLGAGILKRFQIIMDYPHSQISLRKNGRFYRAPFLYNKSGMEVVHGGEMLVKEHRFIPPVTTDGHTGNISDIFYSYGLAYKPSYKISQIRKGSPAHLAGLRENDFILEINGKPAYSLKMEQIVYILSQKENKKIKVLVDRNGEHLHYEFQLKSLLD